MTKSEKDLERERVLALYDDNISNFCLLTTGVKIGVTSKAKLKKGIVDELEDETTYS